MYFLFYFRDIILGLMEDLTKENSKIIICMESDIIFGEMVENIMVNKLLFLGGYMNDKKHGYGKYIWSDGRKYIGYWDNGKQNGYGKYYTSNGNAQYGLWTKGRRSFWLTDEQITKLKENSEFMKVYTDELISI